MPLTPEDVSNKRFTPVRLREGYDMGEVDQFLDEVESELARLIKDNDDLRERLRVAQDGSGSSADSPFQAAAEPAATTEPVTLDKPVEEPAAEVVPDEPAAPVIQKIHVTTAAEASSAATRLLEMATNNADQLVAAAQVDADAILSDARTQAEQLETDSQATADRLEAEARSRSQMLDAETVERRTAVVGELEKEKGRLNTEVENLRAFEREYRSRLKSYFTQQLTSLENDESGVDSDDPGAPTEQPKRLRSLLSED